MKFSSEGYDLDAIKENAEADDVVFEVGGGASLVEKKENHEEDRNAAGDAKKQQKEEEKDENTVLMEMAEDYKFHGNEAFKAKEYAKAAKLYSSAIRVTPGMTGRELLRLKNEWEEQEQLRMRKQMQEEDQKRRQKEHKREQTSGDETNGSGNDDDDIDEDETTSGSKKAAVFSPPNHTNGKSLAIYHCNRAAALLVMLQQEREENHDEQSVVGEEDDAASFRVSYAQVISDCTVSILLNAGYTKAYSRRATAFEKTEQTDRALEDAKKAFELDPINAKLRQHAARLQKIEDERLEKLKKETMDKLKDLGNSILGNFGLSLDNFKAEQDPKTGSYSISFQQGNDKN